MKIEPDSHFASWDGGTPLKALSAKPFHTKPVKIQMDFDVDGYCRKVKMPYAAISLKIGMVNKTLEKGLTRIKSLTLGWRR